MLWESNWGYCFFLSLEFSSEDVSQTSIRLSRKAWVSWGAHASTCQLFAHILDPLEGKNGMRFLHLGNWNSPLMKSINMIWSWVNIPQIKLSEQMPENWQHIARSQKKNLKSKLTVVTEWKDRIMCKEFLEDGGGEIQLKYAFQMLVSTFESVEIFNLGRNSLWS